jgi:putative aminopeptidase FrvX
MANPKNYLSKAFDNRMGCATAIGVLQYFKRVKHPNAIFAGATAQEEVGLRGAQTIAHLVDPDVCFSVDVGVAQDIPPDGLKKSERLGNGPSILIYDGCMLPNVKFRDLIIETAQQKRIPFHLTYMERGCGDGGRVHVSRLGVPTIYIGAPVRYIHAHNGIMNRADYDNTVRLICEIIKKLDAKTVKSFTQP